MEEATQDERWDWIVGLRERLRHRLLPRVGPDYVDDATHEALVRAATARSAPRAEARLGWLTRIGLNWRVDQARLDRRIEELSVGEHVTFALSTVEAVDLRTALTRLSRGDRMLLLRVARGERYDELSRRLGITPAAARQRVARARVRLAADLSVNPPRSRAQRKDVGR